MHNPQPHYHRKDRSITCPGCGEVIPISETIYHQVAERAEREIKAKSVRQERALAEREKQLQACEEEFDRRVQEQVKAAAAELQAKAEQQARQSVCLELEDLRRQAVAKDEKLRAAEQAELQLRKQKRDLEERERRLELDTARKLDEERRKIQDQAVRQVEERHRLKDARRGYPPRRRWGRAPGPSREAAHRRPAQCAI